MLWHKVFFFKLIFPQNIGEKMKVGHFCFLQNNWWPKCLISFWLGTCIHHSHGIIVFCVIKIARLLWNWSKKCLILDCWGFVGSFFLMGEGKTKKWLKNEWFLSRSKNCCSRLVFRGMFCYCLEAHYLFKILHFRIWAFRLLTNNNKHEFWLGCFSIIKKRGYRKKISFFVKCEIKNQQS